MSEPILPKVKDLVDAYDKKNWREVDDAHYRLKTKYGLVALLPLMIVVCKSLKSWKARKTVLFYLLPHVRDYPALLDLALSLLNDRARMVREEALGIIAYSLEKRALTDLRAHIDHPDADTRAAVLAAIDAIENQNHNLFLDRDHAGNVQWIVRER